MLPAAPAVWAAILVLALLFSGCAKPPIEIGYSGENYSAYHELNETVRLVDKAGCFFGETPFLIKTEDNASCAYLNEGHFYNIQGMIVRQERVESPAMNVILQTLVNGDGKIVSDRQVYVDVPVIALYSAREVKYPDVFLEQKLWEKPIGRPIDLTCESAAVTDPARANGGANPAMAKTVRLLTVSVDRAMLGRMDVLNRTFYPFIVEVGHPEGMQAMDANLTLAPAVFVGGYGETVGNATYFEFDLPDRISGSDVKDIRFGLANPSGKTHENCYGQLDGLPVWP